MGSDDARDREQSFVRRWTRRILLWGLSLTAAGFALFAFVYATTDIPSPNTAFQSETSLVYFADGTEMGKFASQNRESVPLSEMGSWTQQAVIAAEDRTFYTNRGIDPKGILRAAINNLRGNPTQGASTITQQYVKVLYLNQERSYKRKLTEAIVALKLQSDMDKSEVLERYLNTIYFGRGAYGIEAAAQNYFGVSAKQLNLRQAAMLAAVIKSPNNLDPSQGRSAKSALLSRYLYVLEGMVDLGSITSSQYANASARLPVLPKLARSNGYTGQEGYVMELVRKELTRLGYSDQEIDGGGLRIKTSIDPEVMQAAQDAVLAQRPSGLPDLHVAVASVDPKTGGLKGIYAGEPYEKTNGGINWAMAGGAPGSTFKPIAVAAALKEGYSLNSSFDGNSPYVVGSIEFNNQGSGEGTDRGSSVSLTNCTAYSVNTCFIDLADSMENGAQKIFDMARTMGIPRRDYQGRPNGLKPEVGISLGSATISPIDLANAYATIADEGRAKKWYVVQSVTTSDGTQVFNRDVKSTQAFSPEVAADTTYALTKVAEYGTGKNANSAGRPIAGKTGTATDSAGRVRSSWFAGFTPELATAVMYVRGNGNEPLDGYLPTFFGGEYPARTWGDFMARALAGKPVTEFPEPAFLTSTVSSSSSSSGGYTPYEPYTPPPYTPPPPLEPRDPNRTPEPSTDPTPEPEPEPTTQPTPPAPTPSPCTGLACPRPAPPNQRE